MESLEYKAFFVNIKEFPDYIFIMHTRNCFRSDFYPPGNYYIINSSDEFFDSNKYCLGDGMYFIEKSNFKDINITLISFAKEDIVNVTYPNGSLIEQRKEIGIVNRYYYNFQLDKNYSLWNFSYSEEIIPCGSEEYPFLREDYFRIVSLEKNNTQMKLDKTVWIFYNGTKITVDNPPEDMKMPIVDRSSTELLFIPLLIFLVIILLAIPIVLKNIRRRSRKPKHNS